MPPPTIRKIPLHRDPKIRALVFQAAVAVILVWSAYTIALNTVNNMEERGILIGLGFIDDIATFQVTFTPFWDFKLGESKYWEVFLIAVQNTIFVSFWGVIGATALGFLIGIMRLSPNWLVAKIASVYVETFRNIPLLLWFFFWYIAVFLPILPTLKDTIVIANSVYINTGGIFFPRPAADSNVGLAIFWMFIIGALGGAFYLVRWAKRRQEETGAQFPLGLAVTGIIILVPFVGFFIAGSPLHLEYPEAGRFQMSGGMQITVEFFACWFALTSYTAAFIGENVRGGILAVSHGQTEASRALGLKHGQNLKLVIIPQAMRVIIPPTISQFLNLTKNSTLAVAVAYEEIASLWLGIALNTTGQALVIIAMGIGVFWMLSLSTSALLNWYNNKVQLTER